MMLWMTLVVTLLVAGAALLMLETILPGMIAGVLGFICLIAGVAQGFVELGPRQGGYLLLGVLAFLGAGTALWLRFFPDTRFARVFISQSEVGGLNVEKPELVGRVGTALTALRPSGMALIEGRRVDVVTEGMMVERGAPVRVVAVEGLRVVVRAGGVEPKAAG